jgi:hypothetical protein
MIVWFCTECAEGVCDGTGAHISCRIALLGRRGSRLVRLYISLSLVNTMHYVYCFLPPETTFDAICNMLW